MADTRYTMILNTVMRSLGYESAASFRQIVSTTGSSTTADIFDRYVNMAARYHSSLHPRGFAWRNRIKEMEPAAVTHKIAIGSVWDSASVPEFNGFTRIRAKSGASGEWIDVQRVSIDDVDLNLKTLPTGYTPEQWAMSNESGAVYLNLYPYTIVATTSDIYLHMTYIRQIPSIDGASNPDESMIWDNADDDPIALWTTAFIARQTRNWDQYRASVEMAYMASRERIQATGLNEIGMSLNQILLAIDRTGE